MLPAHLQDEHTVILHRAALKGLRAAQERGMSFSEGVHHATKSAGPYVRAANPTILSRSQVFHQTKHITASLSHHFPALHGIYDKKQDPTMAAHYVWDHMQEHPDEAQHVSHQLYHAEHYIRHARSVKYIEHDNSIVNRPDWASANHRNLSEQHLKAAHHYSNITGHDPKVLEHHLKASEHHASEAKRLQGGQ